VRGGGGGGGGVTLVRGLIKETDRWIAFQCFSCRTVTVEFRRGGLAEPEVEQVENEIDQYVISVLKVEAQYTSVVMDRMTPAQLDALRDT